MDSTPWDAGAAEAALLGILINDSASMYQCIATGLKVAHFSDQRHANIWTALVSADRENRAWDMVSVALAVKPENAAYVAQLSGEAPLTLTGAYYAREVVASAWQRDSVGALQDMCRRIVSRERFQPVAPIQAAALDLVQLIGSDVGDSGDRTPEPVELVNAWIDYTERRIVDMQQGIMRGVRTGFTRLDEAINGFMDGGLYVIGARPGMGKTTLAATMAMNAASAGAKVAYFTLEMSAIQIFDKIVSAESRVPGDTITTGDLSEDEVSRVHRTANVYCGLQMRVNERSAATIQRLESEAKRMHREGKLQVLFIDYLQLMRVENARFANRQAEVTEITGRLKRLAMHLQVPVVVLAQVGREAAKSVDKVPQLIHLKESGSIEQDADVVLLLHRDGDDDDRQDWIIIAKNRHGRTGKVGVVANMAFHKFEN